MRLLIYRHTVLIWYQSLRVFLLDPMAANDGSVNSSERTVSDVATGSVQSSSAASFSSAHHYISIKLDHRNFLFWRTQVVPFLRGHDLIELVDGSCVCPAEFLPAASEGAARLPNPAYAAWVRRDQALLSLLVSSLSEDVLATAVGCQTSKELWDALEQSLASASHSRQLHGLRQGDSTTAAYLGRARLIVEGLALAGRKVSLEEQNLYVFRGLRPEFRGVTSSLAVRL